jgi:hypothetical protein
LQPLAEIVANKHGVSSKPSECDHILGHMPRKVPANDDRAGLFQALLHYFDNGALNSQQIRDLMSTIGLSSDASVLEFASGYGRVSRHLMDLNLVSCDIHPEAVNFLSNVLGVRSMVSAEKP